MLTELTTTLGYSFIWTNSANVPAEQAETGVATASANSLPNTVTVELPELTGARYKTLSVARTDHLLDDDNDPTPFFMFLRNLVRATEGIGIRQDVAVPLLENIEGLMAAYAAREQ